MRTPAAVGAVPRLAGSGVAILLFDRLPDLFGFVTAAAALLALLAALAAFGTASDTECTAAIVSGCVLAGLSLGAGGAERAYGPPLLRTVTALPAARAGEPVLVEGTLREDAALTGHGTLLSIDVDRIDVLEPEPRARPPGLSANAEDRAVSTGLVPRIVRRTAGGVRLSVAGSLNAGRVDEWRAGRRVRVPALLRTPSVYRDPGVPDEARALARRGIVLVGTVKSSALVEVLSGGSLSEEAAGAARSWVRARLASHVGTWSARSSGVASAITIGDRTGLSSDDERRLQEAGTYHVIAISGGNIAILTAILLTCLRLVRVPRRLSAGLVIAALLFYGQLTGAPPSVARAVTAAVVYLAGRVLDHRGPPLNALAVAALFAVMAAPLTAADAGFVLSFGATLGILILVPRLAGSLMSRTRAVDSASEPSVVASAFHPSVVASAFRRKKRPRLPASLFTRAIRAAEALLIATLCAEIALAPLSALLFLRITFAGLFVNFAAIPLMGVVQAGSLLTLAVAAPLPRIASLAGYSVHLAAAGLVESSRLVDLVPWLSLRVPAPAPWVVLLYYAGCLAALVQRTHTRPSIAVAATALALMIAGPPWATRDGVFPPPPGWLRVVMLDVGQGDATIVWLPDGRTLLVDAAGLWVSQAPGAPAADTFDRPSGAFDVGERVVAPALRAIGVRRLDTLVLTHGDPDHIGGAPAVLRWGAPRVIWEGAPVPPFEPVRALQAMAAAGRIAWRNVQAGDLERHGAVDIRVLHPPVPDWERQRVRNDDSIVLDLRLGGVSVVLPGDIGAEGERAVLSRIVPAPVVILKVPHHGSATSSTPELLAALRPAAAIVSAGRDNRFGHPAPVVLARYRDAGVPIFRTDRDGAVFVDTDGTRVWIRGWTGWELTLANGKW